MRWSRECPGAGTSSGALLVSTVVEVVEELRGRPAPRPSSASVTRRRAAPDAESVERVDRHGVLEARLPDLTGATDAAGLFGGGAPVGQEDRRVDASTVCAFPPPLRLAVGAECPHDREEGRLGVLRDRGACC